MRRRDGGARNGRMNFVEGRMQLFRHLMSAVPLPIHILDVGGTVNFWEGQLLLGWELTIINIVDQQPLQGEIVLVGNGCDLPFDDYQYDVVFSNSVLAQVTTQQADMAQEIRRVAKRYFVQTPNQGFPLDWRTRVLFFHWLPAKWQARAFQTLSVGRYPRVNAADAQVLATRIRDVNKDELQALFPDGTVILEKVLGLTKSFIVHRGFERD